MAKTPYPQTDRELVRRIERSAGHRAGYKQLVRELGLGGGRERRLLLEQLARITARGELVKTELEQWALPEAAFEKTARVTTRGEMRMPASSRVARDARPAGGGQARSASRWLRLCAAQWKHQSRRRSVYSAQ